MTSEIPHERLPEGFADRVRSGPPSDPRPAATVVLTRPGESGGIEVLLMRRVRSAGFVPGAWVFPGGRVDGMDRDPRLVERVHPPDAELDAPFPTVVAALREAFEETGILVGRDGDGRPLPTAAQDDEVDRLRGLVLAHEVPFADLLIERDWRMDFGAVGYIAHWITPEAEPRRYDTRFFAAAVTRDATERIHEAEATAAIWVSPAEALRRRADGELPMIFPTLRTLEALREFDDPVHMLDHYRGREIPTILPTLVHTPTGVGIKMPDED